MVGVSSDPVRYTGLGLKYGVDTVLDFLYGSKSFIGRSIAIQGVGKVGSTLVGLLYKDAKKIYVADTDNDQLRKIKRQYPKVEIVTVSQIYSQKVDIFSPCALGNALTAKNITKIKAPIILGGANNQLESPHVGEILHKLGILYAPDYIVNAGGLISVVDEYEHKKFDNSRILRRLNNVKVILRTVLKKSLELKKSTNRVADEMAEKIFNNK
jgi:glutamate dehydrogenase/leucine dehydrogenase